MAIRKRNLYQPGKPFKLSRSKIDLFIECPRCFYIDRRLGVGRPPGFPFNINSAVDELLKKEFDKHREAGTPHPLMVENGIDAIPYKDERMDEWRDSLRRGIQYHDEKHNLTLTGGVDDVWVNPEGELIIVDYKATSKNGEVSLDAEWQNGYKRQMEIYQWLFRKNGFEVNNTGYFVYCNGDRSKAGFNNRIEFTVSVLAYDGDDSWIEEAIENLYTCLNDSQIPEAGEGCEYCSYIADVSTALS